MAGLQLPVADGDNAGWHPAGRILSRPLVNRLVNGLPELISAIKPIIKCKPLAAGLQLVAGVSRALGQS